MAWASLRRYTVSINYSKKTQSLVEAQPTSVSIVASPPQGTLTYEPYFGLNEKPFSLSADSRFVYESPSYLSTANGLLAGIQRREGVLVLTGQIGNGKTTLCRAVLARLGPNTFSSLVLDPFASREDLLKMLLIDFGVLSIQELAAASLRQASRTELGYMLAEFLDSLAPEAFVVVIIDEAQNLSLPLIEEMRLLSDTFGAKGRLQLVFAGQPELHAKLKLPEMRQVDQRICGYYRLAPLNRDAVAGYIQHRLQVAGGRRDRVLFPPEIIDSLYARSGGVPRLINRVCDRALQLAYEQQAGAVDRELLDTALIEVGPATLSPTWDSIMFAEPPTPVRPAVEALTSAPAHRMETLVPIDAGKPSMEDTDSAMALNLTAPPLSPAFSEFPSEAIVGPVEPARPAAERPSGVRPVRPAPKRELSSRAVRTDRGRPVRAEMGMQRSSHVWAKQAAMALALLALVAVMAGATLLPDALAAPALPAVPKAPLLATPGLRLPPAPPTDAAAAAAMVSVAVPARDRMIDDGRDQSAR
jgi:type II secretory pathway predicted ATPase ExeA